MPEERIRTDALVIGGGIAGLQTAMDLADQGFLVTVVESKPSIGGNMIALSKVFPTLDCASCITTPKMAAAAHHEKITLLTYSEVESIVRSNGGFSVTVIRKPRYVIEKDCIGCKKCEYACPVEVTDEFEQNMGTRRAAYIPFSNAIPQFALIDMDNCILCGSCAKACPTDAIDFNQKPKKIELEAGTVILATGFELTPRDAKPHYGGGKIANVLSPLQMERLLAPHGPYGRVLRPADGKVPDSIAYVQCAGSRDSSIGVPYCSRVCCMYAIKQAMLLSGALPVADITIYYMDIRAFGKGYDQFYQNAKAMGIEFVKGKVARIEETDSRDVTVRYERIDDRGQVEERRHDLVVLSLGMLPACDASELAQVELGSDNFILTPQIHQAGSLTSEKGVFAAGTASGPKDIVDTIIEAGAAAMEASNYLRQATGKDSLREPAGRRS